MIIFPRSIFVIISLTIIFIVTRLIFVFRKKSLRYSFKKDKSITKLLALICAESCNDDEHPSPEYKYTHDKSEIWCVIDSNIYHGVNGNPQSVTLIDAMIVQPENVSFLYNIYDQSWWPQGVEFLRNDDNNLSICIKVNVDLDYDDDPKEELLNYIAYLHELQTSLVLKYNQFRADRAR